MTPDFESEYSTADLPSGAMMLFTNEFSLAKKKKKKGGKKKK